MPATLVSEIQPCKYGSELSRKSVESKNANIPQSPIHCTISLKFGTMVEDHCGHKMSKICLSEILVTRLIFLKFRTLAHISKMAAKTTSGSFFDFRFVFSTADLLKNEYNIEGVPPTLRLSFFRPHFSIKISETNFDGQYLRKGKT